MQLFAAKGASATSMQEIADVCGMSKGSLYLHFKSKEELEQSMYDYCYLMLQEHLLQAERQVGISPREQLCRQIEVALELVLELREFLLMQFRDWIKNGSTAEPESVKAHNARLLKYGREKLVFIYGPDIVPYTMDLLLIVHGMLGTYIKLMFHPQMQINIRKMANHLVDLIDLAAQEMLSKRPEPLLSEEILNSLHQDNTNYTSLDRHPLLVIKDMKMCLGHHVPDSEQCEQVLEALQILEDELMTLKPRRAILSGMISILEHTPGLENQAQELGKLVVPFLKP